MKFVSSISGLPISAGSAAYAPTNGADVSAVASAYAESAASGKLDSTASSQFITSTDGLATTEYVDSSVSSKLDTTAFSTVSSNFLTSETVTATAGDGTYVTSINGMGISGQGGGGGAAFPVEYNSGNCSASLETGYFVSTSRPSLTLSSTDVAIYPRFIVSNGTGTASKGSYYLSDAFEFTTGTAGGSGKKVLRVDPQQVSSKNFLLYGPSGSNTYGMLELRGSNSSAYVQIGSGADEHKNFVRPSSISSWWDVHDTVSANSASWGGGSVTSPSGTIFVKDGTAIEGTNSAVVVDQTSIGVTSVLPKESQVNSIGPQGMTSLTYGNLNDSGMNLVFMLAGAYYGNDATVIISGYDSYWNLASASGLIVDGDTSANIPLGTVQSQLSASSDYWINLMYGEDLSGVKAPGYAVTGVGELAWKSAVDNVTDTVSANSASWGGGATGNYVETSAVEVGVGYMVTASGTSLAQGSGCTASSLSFAQGRKCNATTVSFAQGLEASADDYSIAAGGSVSARQTSVAFGYGNRAYEISLVAGTNCSASSRSVALGTMCRATATSMAVGLGVSGFSGVTAFGKYNSGRYGTGENGVAFVIGDGSYGFLHDLMRVTKDGEITMYSSTADTVGTGIMSSIRAISAAATGGGVDSATVSAIASSYAESAVSSVSGNYAQSADVSATVDLVSTQSANWGGSALNISAGPGISVYIDNGVIVIATASV